MANRLLLCLFCTTALFAGETHPLQALLAKDWELRMEANPTWASMLGDKRFNDRWPDYSLEAMAKHLESSKALLGELQHIDLKSLSAEDQLNYRLFQRDLESQIGRAEFKWYLVPMNQREGIQGTDQLAGRLDFSSRKDYDDWLKRLKAFPAYMDQYIGLMREGARTGMIHAKVTMERVPPQIEALLVEDPTQSGFYSPFRNIPQHIEGREQLAEAGKEAVAQYVLPAYRKFKTFFEKEYLPKCYDKVGFWQAPRGGEMYEFFVKHFTTTELTPQQVHDIGQREVARIRAEMMKIIEQVGFEGSFAEFLHFLRTDKQFYYDSSEELYTGYLALAKRIDPNLVKLFRLMPRTPYGVTPIPDNIAPDTTTAYYMRPSADGTRAGQFYVNLYQPETRPKYEMEALALHESVPGHHFQIALTMELGELPNFRRFGGIGAFVEGWALYCESLGDELGFYQDPYSKFGQLTYEMWRAVRLVVDTGIHYLKWDRQKAIDFFKDNAAKSEADIVNEIDRYIAWPGQALGYKIGELKIKELRKRAEAKLGNNFKIRDFHDQILMRGPLTLDVLEFYLDDWMNGVAEGK